MVPRATKPSILKLGLSPISLLRIFWKHPVTIVVVAVLGSAAAALVVFKLPSSYRSEALILVEWQQIPDRYVSSTVNTEVQDQLASISQEILSATRLQNIIDDFGLYRDERNRLVPEELIDLMRKDISIKLETGWTRERPGAFRVGYRSKDPALAREVANRLASLFIEGNLKSRERQAVATAAFIESQLRGAKDSLDQLEVEVSKYKLAHNGDLPEQQNTLNTTLAGLQVELQGNQDAINRGQQNRVTLQGTLDMSEAAAGAVWSNAATNRGKGARTGPALKKESEYLQTQYDALRQRYQPNYPKMIDLQRQIEKQKAAEDAQDARIENLRTQIGLVDREIQELTIERKQILKAIAQYQARIEQLPVREQEMAALTRDYENAKANYKSLLDKKLAAGMATDMERGQKAERFTMLDPPRVPQRPVSPKKPLLYGTGCAISLALGLAFAIATETKKNAVLGEWELPEGIEVLGRVPFIDPASSIFGEMSDSKPAGKQIALAARVGSRS